MKRQLVNSLLQAGREFASAAKGTRERKVAILGAAGGIGQPLSMLMKVGARESRQRPFSRLEAPR